MRRSSSTAITASLAAALLVGGCRIDGSPGSVTVPADEAAGEVALEATGPQDAALVVPVHINGAGPFSLVLDTGATFTCVTPAVVEALQLPEQRGAVGYGTGVHATARVPIVRFDSVRVGSAVAHGMSGCVLELAALGAMGAEVDGLLGLNFLREFDVRLDFRRSILTLTAPASD
jgi:predicted aspartyl protease